MKKFKLVCTVEEYASIDKLNDRDKKLLSEAVLALQHAYAPYSKFKVGCALLLEDGTIIHGSNQENAAYPSGLCAERVAFFNAGANYAEKKIVSVAITTANKLKEPVTPCGSCRQVMAEYERNQKSNIRVLLSYPGDKIYAINSISELLPMQFRM